MDDLNEITDFMAEYRTVPELTLTGVREDLSSWTLEVAKVGGGTLGRFYQPGERWIVNSFIDHELMESVVVESHREQSHLDVIDDIAGWWFGI